MDEIAAKQVLLDFEVIVLIALFAGIGVFSWFRRRVAAEGGEKDDFDGFDLALMFFPALLFLFNPLLELYAAKSPAVDSGGSSGVSVYAMLINIAYFFFVGLMTYGIIEWVRNRSVVEIFGLRRLSFPSIVVFTIVGGVAAIVICAWALGNVSQSFLERVFTDLAAQETVEALQQSESTVQVAFSIVMACIAAPLVEELLFRGYMYGALKKATNPIFSAVIIGALFAVVHGNLPALLPLWAFSILLCCAYEWTRCLWVPIGMHAFFNGANILLMRFPEAFQ